MQKGDALQLTIANHQLEGKKVALKKPFAILQPEATDQAGLCQSYKVVSLPPYRMELAQVSPGLLCYIQVIGMLHDKYLFKTRPRPLISKPDPTKRR